MPCRGWDVGRRRRRRANGRGGGGNLEAGQIGMAFVRAVLPLAQKGKEDDDAGC